MCLRQNDRRQTMAKMDGNKKGKAAAKKQPPKKKAAKGREQT